MVIQCHIFALNKYSLIYNYALYDYYVFTMRSMFYTKIKSLRIQHVHKSFILYIGITTLHNHVTNKFRFYGNNLD